MGSDTPLQAILEALTELHIEYCASQPKSWTELGKAGVIPEYLLGWQALWELNEASEV